MDERTKRIEELFRLGVVVPHAERSGFLQRHCGGDAALERELAALLAQDDQGTKVYLESPVISRWRKSDTSRAEDPLATEEVLDGRHTERIGRYAVLHELGEGGMGMVYLAEQSEPVRRRVALKVVKLGMDTRRVVARFDRERQALAMMDHPGIARIYDGGTTESGRPYFVMEYVPGKPLTDYCDDAQLDVRGRLELFVRVCEAVQHAHQRGIVHRDLKPSNVLVAEGDGQPVAKVIDFGIARATQDEEPGRERATRASEIIGTYAYMSPEQADPACLDVDGRADVYSLGVMLFELLTGSLPVDAEDLHGKSPSEVSHLLLGADPLSPSTKLTRMGSGVRHVASCRGGLEPRALVRQLHGDLDWIALRAMERDPARRYPSAAALAGDVRRHLNHQTVLAGPPSLAYRARKFVRRRRVGLTAAGIIVLTLASGAMGTFLGFSEASEEAQVARAAESEARVAAESARRALAREEENRESLERYSDSLLDLVDLTDPEAPLRSDESAVSLLTDLRENVAKVYAEDPLGEAFVRVRIARAMRMRGELELAGDDLRRAQELQERFDAPTTERLATVRELHALAVDTSGYADYADGLAAAALEVQLLLAANPKAGAAASALLKSATTKQLDRLPDDLEMLQKSLPGGDRGYAARVLAGDVVGLAGGYLGLHLAFAEAEPLLDASLEMHEALFGPTHPEAVDALDDLVAHLYQQGKDDVALQVVAARVPAFHARFSADHWLRAHVDSLYGECLSLRGDGEQALALLQAAHDAILRDRGPRSSVAVHSALRLRDHYARSADAVVPPELDALLASAMARSGARSREAGGAWLRTAAVLGADEHVTAALTELFGPDGDPAAKPGPPSARAADVLAALVADRAGAKELGDFVARALVVAEPRTPAADYALVHPWSRALELAQARVDALELSRADAEAARIASETKPPAPRTDDPSLERHDAPRLAVPAAEPSGADGASALAFETEPSAPVAAPLAVLEAIETLDEPVEPEGPGADELILFAWLVSSYGESKAEHFALALEASDLALAMAPDKPDYGIIRALALARVGAWQAALDELDSLEEQLGGIGFHGLAARALAHDMGANERAARRALTQAEIQAFFFPGALPKGTVGLILELEQRLAD